MIKFSKLVALFSVLILLCISRANAQTWIVGMCSQGPPSSSTSSIYGPMYSTATVNATSRHAIIYPASQLNTIFGANISNIYFNKASTTAAMLGTPNFKIYMKEVAASDWGSGALTWATAIQGATLVYDGNPVTAVGTTLGWKNFQLSTNFSYSGSQNLAIFFEYQNATASNSIVWSYDYTAPCVSNTNATKYVTNTSGSLGASLTTSSSYRPYIGFDYTIPNCTGTPAVPVVASTVTNPCPSAPFTLTAAGVTNATGITFDWQTYNNTTSSWVSTGGTSGTYTVSAGITANTQYRLKTTCTLTNLSSLSNVYTVNVGAGLPGGTYTINNGAPTAGTNYHSFAEAIAAMNCGINGPVVFNVTPGTPYVETITIPNITGSSATRTIRFNGNGATVQFTNTTANPQLLTFNGARYVKVDSINFKALATDNGWGANITNGATYDSITRCKFDLTAVTILSSIAANGISISGSATSPTSTGLGGTHCYVGNNYVAGPAGTGGMYYGLTVSPGGNDSNAFVNNRVENFYLYGFYLYSATGTLIQGNDINRAGKTGSISTFYGIYLGGNLPNTKIINNRIHDPMAASATGTTTFYGIYNFAVGDPTNPILIANNLIYSPTMNGLVYSMYNSGASYVNIYHNTISIDKALTGTSANYGIYVTGTSNGIYVKNNLVSVTAGTLGSKYGFYYSSGTVADAQRNNIYVSSSQTGNQYYGSYGANYLTIAAFQTANPTLEVGSTILNPQFVSIATGNYKPSNNALFATGTNTQSSVPSDILGLPRTSLPTPGAYEIMSTTGNDAGVAGIASPTGTVCVGPQALTVKVVNGGTNIINNLQVYWTINGTLQPTVNYGTPINTITSTQGNVANVLLGTVNFTTAPIAIKAWTYLPNGTADTFLLNDTLSVSIGASLSGTFTVNSALATGGTNYQSFTELANDLNTYGVCGPLTVNVVAGSGPYTEFVNFNNIPGTSAINKIKINGNGVVVQFTNTTTNRQLLTLNGTKYLSIDSITFKALSPTFGWGALVTAGAAFDSITRCIFDLTVVTSTSSVNTAGITFSGSNTSPTTTGTTGSNCYLGYNKILGTTGAGGPYYAVTFMGTHNANVFEHNLVSNFYYYGIYVSGGTNLTLNANDVNRATKTSVTTFYGIELLSAMPGLRVTNNRIHDPADPAATGTGSFYGLYASSANGVAASRNLIANNALYNINLNGGSVYALYIPSVAFTDVYHNTVVVDKALTGTSSVYGIYGSGSSANATLKNNNVSITGGTLGPKYGFYISATNTFSDQQRNNFYVNSSQAGAQYYGYFANNYSTISDFQAANATLEVGSVSVDPQFAPLSTNLVPGNYLLFGNGSNLLASVPTDILGVARNAMSTPGAFEIAPMGTNNAGSVNLITPKGSFCAGIQPINVSVVNAGINNITTMKIHWQLNGVDQPVYNFNTTLNSINNGGQFIDTVLLGNAQFNTGTPTTIKIWTATPNNGSDIYNGNDTITFTLQPSQFSINAVKDTLCLSTGTSINLTPATGYIPGNLKWQKSSNGSAWIDIPTSDVVSYNTGNLTADNFYRVKINSGINGCYSDTVKILVVNPQLLGSEDLARCGPGTINLDASVSLNALVKWYDSPTATTPIATGTSFVSPYLGATTTFYVSAGIGSSPSTCETAKTPVVATVNPVPHVDLGLDQNICGDADYVGVLNAGLQPNTPTFLWDNGTTSQIRNFDSSGNYYVAVTNQFGCTGSDTVKVNLRQNPVVELGNDTTICNNSTLVLDAGGDGTEYFWNTGQLTQTITINAASTYNVFVTNDDGCTVADTITVHMSGELPAIQGIIITNNGQYTFQFTALNPQDVVGYEWDFGDNTAHSYLQSPTHTYADNGNYVVVLRLSSTCGFLSDTASAHIVGIHQINVAADEMVVYPNPTNAAATILNRGDLKMERIEIYNIAGQVVYRADADSKDKHVLQLSNLASGVYTIQIFTDKGNVSRKLDIVK